MYRRGNQSYSNQQHQPPLLRPFRVHDYNNPNYLNRNKNFQAPSNSSELCNLDYIRDGQDGELRGVHAGGRTDLSNYYRGNYCYRNYRNQRQHPVNPDYVLRPMPNQPMFQQPTSQNRNHFPHDRNCTFENGGQRSRWSTTSTPRSYSSIKISALRKPALTILHNTQIASDELSSYEDPALLLASQIEKQTKQHSIRFNTNPLHKNLLLSNPLSLFQRNTNNRDGALIDEEALVRPNIVSILPPFTPTGHYHGDRYYEPINQLLDKNSSMATSFVTSGSSDIDDRYYLPRNEKWEQNLTMSSSFDNSASGNLCNYGNHEMTRNSGSLGTYQGLASISYHFRSGFSLGNRYYEIYVGNLASTSGGPLFPGQPSTGGTNYLSGIFPFGKAPQVTGQTHHILASTGCGMHFQMNI